ncbi:MAG: hypothetical protein ABIB71_05020 [Candidatus Woesearchaeota archaeon]
MLTVYLNKNVDDFLKGYSKLETPEERMEGKVEGEVMFEGFDELIRQYEEILAIDNFEDQEQESPEIMGVLGPERINVFLQATVKYEQHENYSGNTGLFITQLIQNSHDSGNNKFTLNTKALSKEIDNICSGLKGKGNNLLEIIIDGKVGDLCSAQATNMGKLHIGGNAGDWCGYSAKNIKKIYMGGNAGSWCGAWAENIKEVYIGGNAGYNFGWEAKNIGQLYIVGNAEEGCGEKAENSTFKTPNKETLRQLKNHVPKKLGNKLSFIKEDGSEEEIRW